MKRIFCSIVLLASAMCGWAQYESELALVVTTKDGQGAVYALREKPLVTLNGNDLEVKTKSMKMQYVFADLQSFVVINTVTDIEAARKLPVGATKFDITKEALIANSLQPGEELQLFSVDGKHIATARASQDGSARLSLSGIGTEVVIVKTQSFTYKIQMP